MCCCSCAWRSLAVARCRRLPMAGPLRSDCIGVCTSSLHGKSCGSLFVRLRNL
ncbi:hypothetical protein B0T21DRAFT_375851 [Apiosordaria backusii]|uniref:Uncharacterized protein n=1 Tax=Apiosordaria backusii TaxID=314023 RepID=A0AA40AEL1_9PEZI|nr:hypothetical protein B0T21DRAFT_375851 [Apiosordaria backusii]